VKSKDEKADDDLAARLVGWYDQFEHTASPMLKAARRCRDYYDGNQLTDEEIKALRDRKQPPLVYNQIKPKVDFLIGFEGRQKTDPKAFPRTPLHADDAEAVTDSLRFLTEREDLDTKRSRVWHDLLTAGWGGVQKELRRNPRTDEIDVIFSQNKWDRMWWDVHSCEYDFSDARYLGLVVWLDLDIAKQRYKGKADALEAAKTSAEVADTHDDKPAGTWIDKRNERVKICLCYYNTGQGWAFAEFTKGNILRKGDSPFEDENGVTEHPFIWESAYVDSENNRYGLVKEMLDPQDGVNKRESKLMHLLNARQSFHKKGAVGDAAAFKEELAKADGSVELNEHAKWGEDVGVIESNADVAGHFQLLQEDKAQIKDIGPNPSIQGKPDAQLSGRALQAQQQGGLIALGGIVGVLRSFDKRVYRSAWNGIRQFWTGGKWVRVTDDERNVRFVGLNIQAPPGQQLPDNVSLAQQPISQLDVDIIIEDAPDQVTLQGEQFEQLISLAQVGVQFPPQVYIEAAPNLRNKKLLLEITEQGSQPTPQQQAEADKMASETELNRAKSQKEVTEAAKNFAEASNPQLMQ